MNTVWFTLCSRNYLAHATTLADSFARHHPERSLVIGIVDSLEPDTRALAGAYELLGMDEIGEPSFEAMKVRYNTMELITAVKPYFIDYFFRRRQADHVVYLDADMMVFDRLDRIVDDLGRASFVLTPHFVTPIYDEFALREQVVLNTGTFNLGFFAIRRDSVGEALIAWWRRKLFDECIMDQSRGYFVDQKWMNLSICHFDNYCIDKHLGLNMAHWNLHERRLTPAGDGRYRVNDSVPLLFFHFSSYSFDEPQAIARGQTRYSFDSRPDIVPVFTSYRDELASHGFARFRTVTPSYGRPMPRRVPPTIKSRLKSKLVRTIQSW
jgi:hypothetical protein